MANLHGALRTRLGIGLASITQLLSTLNDQFWASSLPEHYAALFFGVYDPQRCRLLYVNAGHTSAFVARASGEREWLPSTAPPIGMFAKWPAPEESRADLRPGDIVITWSDGAIDAGLGARGEEFGEERLAASVESVRSLPVNEIVKQICDRVAVWDTVQHDDYTVLAIRCAGA
jgi:serine phosphatase RsbU (regulator of sigma subunit)